jgi:hypothetical protein
MGAKSWYVIQDNFELIQRNDETPNNNEARTALKEQSVKTC